MTRGGEYKDPTNNEIDLWTEVEVEELVTHKLAQLELLNNSHLCNVLRAVESEI